MYKNRITGKVLRGYRKSALRQTGQGYRWAAAGENLFSIIRRLSQAGGKIKNTMKELIACCGSDCEGGEPRIATVGNDDEMWERVGCFSA